MSGTPVLCVVEQVELPGNKVGEEPEIGERCVGIYVDPLSLQDPDDSFVVLANRSGGFDHKMSWETLRAILVREGKTNLIEMIETELENARVVKPRKFNRNLTNEQLMRILRKRLGIDPSA